MRKTEKRKGTRHKKTDKVTNIQRNRKKTERQTDIVLVKVDRRKEKEGKQKNRKTEWGKKDRRTNRFKNKQRDNKTDRQRKKTDRQRKKDKETNGYLK